MLKQNKMDTLVNNIQTLYDKAESFIETQFELIKLNTIDKSADVISSLTHRVILTLIVGMFILFFNIGLSLWIGKVLQEPFLGFMIVSGFYLVIALLVYLLRKPLIKTPVSNLILYKLLKNNDLDKIIENNS